MEQNSTKPNYAQGIFLTKKKSKAGKDYLELSIKNGDTYDKYLCYESTKTDKYNNQIYSVIVKELPKEDLPF